MEQRLDMTFIENAAFFFGRRASETNSGRNRDQWPALRQPLCWGRELQTI